MNNYIDADRLKRQLENSTYRAKNKFIELINEQDPADVAEVRHGRWVKHIVPTDFDGEVFNVEHIVCSVCEAAIPSNSTYKTKWYSDYCPSCGSRMDLDEEV